MRFVFWTKREKLCWCSKFPTRSPGSGSWIRRVNLSGWEAVQDGNRLRAILLRYYPAALDAFPHLNSVVCLAFLQVYPTPEQAQALSFEQLKLFLREHHHTQAHSWPIIYAALHSDHPRSNPQLDAAYAPLAVSEAKILETLLRSRNACLRRVHCWLLLSLPSWAMTGLAIPLRQSCRQGRHLSLYQTQRQACLRLVSQSL